MAIWGRDDRCSLTHAQYSVHKPSPPATDIRPRPPALARTSATGTRTLTAFAAGACAKGTRT
ncbi:uncharacterized protein CC84DRAFT_462550 [Paraphaeosphaeria sporulosa]|uniref:Uncharacterized protein n=1 Tax=Paraphaeosphaeria sporulosa TaxID=1460663 RepID=A0A177CSB6_9PLEO|nr:uncharacterized protein CC84DRAFT_462550 [Paraphaeosphaeria sporulosa]OAG10091.1 hypothetical protein CC84DRAFT_462550 [Paraphaeosphaeria sporulosa]